MDGGAENPGVLRAGAAVAARRAELGISQRELARQRVITAAALIAFEKGRSWPRERTRGALEELLHWPAGTIARIRAGAIAPETPGIGGPDDEDEVSLVVDAVQVALGRFDTAITDLTDSAAPDFGQRATAVLADLRKLESITVRAVRHSQGAPAVMRALGMVRRRYDQLMLAAAAAPGATVGQRLYAARRTANLTAGEAAAALGTTAQQVEEIEGGAPADAATAHRIEALIAELGT